MAGAPQPIHYLQTNTAEELAVRTVAEALVEKLGALTAVDKLHHSVDHIDALLGDVQLRVTVQAVR